MVDVFADEGDDSALMRKSNPSYFSDDTQTHANPHDSQGDRYLSALDDSATKGSLLLSPAHRGTRTHTGSHTGTGSAASGMGYVSSPSETMSQSAVSLTLFASPTATPRRPTPAATVAAGSSRTGSGVTRSAASHGPGLVTDRRGTYNTTTFLPSPLISGHAKQVCYMQLTPSLFSTSLSLLFSDYFLFFLTLTHTGIGPRFSCVQSWIHSG